MWLSFAFASAFLLGFYDVSKKTALRDNAVIPVLLLNTLFSTVFFCIMMSARACDFLYHAPLDYLLVFVKSVIVLTSWIFGYIGLKHLPITIVGPINATRPVLVLVGAMLIFGERLNMYQWSGVILSFISLFMMSVSSRKENIHFASNKWVFCVAVAAIVGACSGLYDKFIMKELNPQFVQWWYNFFHLLLMSIIAVTIWLPRKNQGMKFHWSWAIIFISVFITLADYLYYQALSMQDSMISVVSLVRRGSVIISFTFGAVLFKEKNLKSKAIDLFLILIGMVLIWIGTN